MAKIGGNRKHQTFRDCEHCGVNFGPLDRLARRFCSTRCAYDHRERTKLRKTLPIARNAQRLVRYYIEKGKLQRPTQCEECKCDGLKIESAHKDYNNPLDVRWLCRSCHVKRDKAEPKHATEIIQRWENLTGEKATKL